MSERVKWLSEVDPDAARDIYANVPSFDLVAVDTKTGIVYAGRMGVGDVGFKYDLRCHLGCDEFAPAAVRARATRKMLRAK